MSDSISKKISSLNRWSIGTVSILQILFAVLIVITANFLSSQYYVRKDLSRSEDFSLTSATTGFLNYSQIKDRKTPVKMIVAFRSSSPFYERVRSLAQEYERISDHKIIIERLDPVRAVDRALQIAKVYNMTTASGAIFREDLIIIDAREDTAAQALGKDSTNNIRMVTLDNMLIYDNEGGKTARRVSAFQGEDALTSALLSAIEGEPRKAYFIADKSDFNTDLNSGSWSSLRDTLVSQNIIPVPVKVSELTEIPADAASVIIASPRYDFTVNEMIILKQYWDKPNSNLLVLLNADGTPPNLRSFLRDHGVTPRRDQILTIKGKNPIYTVSGSFTSGMSFTQDFWNKTTFFDGRSCSLEVRSVDDVDLINRRISPYVLIESTNKFWGETKYNAETPSFDSNEDKAGPCAIAAGVIRGDATDDRFANQSSRMIVISTVDFLQPNALREENLDFLNSCANWLVGRPEMTGAGPRSLGTHRLPLLSSQAAFINQINLVYLPLIALLISLVIWNMRRT
jgi:ABC-type uncharacterized transport system